MTKAPHKSRKNHLRYGKILTGKVLSSIVLASSLAIIAVPAAAQQVGGVNGFVTSSSGAGLSGVAVEARSSVLPGVRTATTAKNGRYQLPLLPPGEYELTFKNQDGTVIKRQTMVLLQQKIKVDVTFGAPTDEVVVVGKKMYVDTGQASLKDTIGIDAIEAIPVGQDYRDLLKLIPGVQYSENAVLGPSAGGSGRDNVYQFDGVDVSLPMFGNLSAEPSSHDIEQISIVRGGAKAIGFNRSGGFLINTSSKRGTNELTGEIGYRVQSSNMSARVKATDFKDETNRQWITASVGGPILKDKLFFYGSYFRPTVDRVNRENAYVDDVPDFESVRDEFFGKLTYAPTSNLLLDVSYRTSDRSGAGQSFGPFEHPSTATSSAATLKIAIAEGSWIIDDTSSLSFKFTDFANETAGRPDTLFGFDVRLGDSLNIGALDQQGRLNVPVLNGDAAHDAFVQPFINQYGYLENGTPTGGGAVGGGTLINNQDFFRTNFEIAYDKSITAGNFTHNLHFGYQYQEIEEDLDRESNGYGSISVLGGREFATDGVTPVFFQARMSQMSIIGANGNTVVPGSIRSSAKLQSFEMNNTIENGDWTFDLGVLISKDILFGQGLRENPSTISGYELAPGNKYKMNVTPWRHMIQPRFGVRYEWTDKDTVYANFARYNPAASSLARAAAWDRNLARDIRINFDANGDFIDVDPIRSSSGKLFQEGIKPRFINEYLVGWERQVNDALNISLHARHRKGGNFWEDTNNTARLFANAPTDIQALGLYIPRLNEYRTQIGSGSSYVIAQLDTGYTEYYEAGLEAEYNTGNFYLQGSYTWSHYYGNFDADNVSTVNDANRFIGSSGIADGVGRQLWDNRDGDLMGDIRHKIKIFGFYNLPWNGQIGAYTIYQSGQPWEIWDPAPYIQFGGSSSSWQRFGEPAGSRRTEGHFQLDLNYTQTVEILDRYAVEFRADLFNVFNSQTGYNIQPRIDRAGFMEPRSFYNPRRIQLSTKVKF